MTVIRQGKEMKVGLTLRAAKLSVCGQAGSEACSGVNKELTVVPAPVSSGIAKPGWRALHANPRRDRPPDP